MKKYFLIVPDSWNVFDLGQHESFSEADEFAEQNGLTDGVTSWVMEEKDIEGFKKALEKPIEVR